MLMKANFGKCSKVRSRVMKEFDNRYRKEGPRWGSGKSRVGATVEIGHIDLMELMFVGLYPLCRFIV